MWLHNHNQWGRSRSPKMLSIALVTVCSVVMMSQLLLNLQERSHCTSQLLCNPTIQCIPGPYLAGGRGGGGSCPPCPNPPLLPPVLIMPTLQTGRSGYNLPPPRERPYQAGASLDLVSLALGWAGHGKSTRFFLRALRYVRARAHDVYTSRKLRLPPRY